VANTAFPMLKAATAAGNGVWGSLNNTSKVTVHVVGLGTGNNGTVVIYGSNTPTAPANTVHHVAMLTATVEMYLVIDAPTKWAKARVTEYIATSSASLSTYIVGGYDG
jgi:hypothetical protein